MLLPPARHQLHIRPCFADTARILVSPPCAEDDLTDGQSFLHSQIKWGFFLWEVCLYWTTSHSIYPFKGVICEINLSFQAPNNTLCELIE